MTSLALLAAFNFDQDKLQTQSQVKPDVNKEFKLNSSHSDSDVHTYGSNPRNYIDSATISQDSSMNLKLNGTHSEIHNYGSHPRSYAESAVKSQNSSSLENDPSVPKSTTLPETTLTPSAALSSQSYERHSSIMRSVYTLKFAPALVLKTKRESNGEKVFINILKGWISDEHDEVCIFMYIHLHIYIYIYACKFLLITYMYIDNITIGT